MTLWNEWASDVASTGPNAPDPTKVTPSPAEIAQGHVMAASFKTEYANWIINQITKHLDAIDTRVFGRGTDGDVTISSGTTSLSRAMFYNNLTINGTGTLRANGYPVFVKQTLTLDGAATIEVLSGSQGGVPFIGGRDAVQGVLSGNGTNGSGIRCLGGDGGDGGDEGSMTNTVGSGGVASGVFGGDFHSLIHLNTYNAFSENYTPQFGGASGGTGAGGTDPPGANRSGDGGAGGGILWIAARDIVWTSGSMQAVGGNGGAAVDTDTGGGGGGGGGAIVVVHRSLSGSPSYVLTGGAGGAGDGTGSAGAAGSAGNSYQIEL